MADLDDFLRQLSVRLTALETIVSMTLAERLLHEAAPLADLAVVRGQATQIFGNTTMGGQPADAAIVAELQAVAAAFFTVVETRIREAPPRR